MMRKVLLLAVGLILMQAQAKFTVQEAAEVGKWTSDFTGAMAKSEAEHRPMVLLWSLDDCGYCDVFKEACETTDFITWQKTTPYLYVCVTGRRGETAHTVMGASVKIYETTEYEGSGALEMGLFGAVHGESNRSKQLSGTPFIAFYWPRSKSSYSITNFMGRIGSMLTRNVQEGFSDITAGQFVSSLKMFFTDYREASLGNFTVTDTEGDRLEAEVTTSSVAVPLSYTADHSAGLVTNWLEAVYPNGSAVTNLVVWAPDESEQVVRVPMTSVFTPTAGAEVALNLWSEGYETSETGAIHVVDPVANAIRNPAFPGEKTRETLDWTDWTLDYDLVTQKVAAVKASGTSAFTLAFYSGVQWCPYCKGMEESLLASTDWTDWLTANRVQPCLFDQDLSPTDAYAWGAGLLTYKAGEEHYNAAGSRALVSGAAYLSRHGLSADDPEVVSVHERSITNSWHTWKAPDSTAVRTSTPALMLIGSGNQVLGRFNAWRDRNEIFGKGQKYYDVTENIGRLNDLLKLGERADESADFAETTREELTEGGSATVALQVNRPAAWYRIPVDHPGRAIFTVTDGTPYPVTLSYVRAGTVLATGAGTLAVELTAEDQAAEGCFLKVSSFADQATTRYFTNAVTTTAFAASVARSFEPMPGVIAFASSSALVQEGNGTVTGSVTRTAGATGAQRVRVMLTDEGTATNEVRFTWKDQTLEWAEGETGAKTFEIPLRATPEVFEGEQTAVFRLTAEAACTATVSEEPFTLTIYDSKDPSFTSREIALTSVGSFAASAELPLYNVTAGARVTLTCTSGALPKGLSLVYDAAANVVRLTGTASTPGVYTATYTVTATQDGETATGFASTITVEVKDPKALNPWSRTGWTASVDLTPPDAPETVQGVLTVTASASGRITARAVTTEATRSFSGKWTGLTTAGELSASLTSRGETLRLLVTDAGELTATVSDLEGVRDLTAEPDAADYRGYYTVTLPVAFPAETAVSGTGYVTLNFTTASALRNRTVSYAGRLPDGAAFSGSARLETDPSDAGHAYLTLLYRSGRGVLSGTLRLRANGASLYLQEEQLRVVLRPDARRLVWNQEDLQVYGGWYERNVSVADWRARFDQSTEMMMTIDDQYAADLSAVGRTFKVTARADRLSLAWSRATGVFSGVARVTLADGRTVSGSYAGVLLPGWVDCGCGLDPATQGDGVDPEDPTRYIERPFASGTFFFRDRVDGRTVTRGLPVDIQ